MESFEDFAAKRGSTVSTWPLSASVFPALSIIGIYLAFTLKVGPNFMSGRNPFGLKYILQVYNLVQIVFNSWMVYRMDVIRLSPQLLGSCYPPPQTGLDTLIAKMSWWFYMNKILDLLDTVFIILRKKYSQLSLLHLYHHSGTVFFGWLHMKYGPGVQYIVVWYVNAVIHVIMYSYYFLAGLGPAIQKYLWWKKYITSLQIVQLASFVIFIIWTANTSCDFPLPLLTVAAANSFVLLILFIRFYLGAYKPKQKVKQEP